MVMRDDYVLITHTYYDQDMEPLKRLEALEIGDLGERTFAVRMRMSKLEEPQNWTEISYQSAEFDVALDDGLFTVFALKSGRAR